MSAEALAALFGKVYNNGTGVELSGGLNFGSGINARLNSAEKRVDIVATAGEGIALNIDAYGASPTASAATNTAAIQAAIDAAEAEGGGRVFGPAGTYSTNATITITGPNVELVGMPGFTLSLTDPGTPGVSISGNNCGCVNVSIVTAGVGVLGNTHFLLTGADCYLIDCDSTDAYQGYQLSGCDRAYVCNCTATDPVNQGLNENASTEDFWVERCTVTGAGDTGIRCTGIRGTLLRNVVLNSGDDGIELNGATDMRVIDNRVSGSVDQDFIDAGSTGTHVRGTYGPTTLPGGGATISAGAITVNETEGEFTVDTEASATYDDLTTINGGRPGQIVVLSPTSSARHTIVKHGTIRLADGVDFALTNPFTRLALFSLGGTTWCEAWRYVISAANVVSGTTHTLTLEDCNRADGVVFTGAAAAVLTVDAVATVPYPVGAKIRVTRQGSGAVVIAMTGSATLNGFTGSSVARLGPKTSSLVIWQRAADEWISIADGRMDRVAISASRSALRSDVGHFLDATSGAVTYTVDNQTLNVGESMQVILSGAGSFTFAESTTTINRKAGLTLALDGQGAVATLVATSSKGDTPQTFQLFGDLA